MDTSAARMVGDTQLRISSIRRLTVSELRRRGFELRMNNIAGTLFFWVGAHVHALHWSVRPNEKMVE